MDEIIRRLRNRDSRSLRALKESMPVKGLNEKDEDEEIIVDDPVTDEPTDEETSQIDDTPIDDEIIEEPESDTDDVSPDSSPSQLGDDADEEESDVDISPDDLADDSEEESKKENVNPLDNLYAVKFTLGQEVLLSYSNGTKSKLKGVIDGYDTEGFYRIKWSNGMTTNGFTDLALLDFIESTKESTCVCGGSNFVNEGDNTVCDNCGRVIGESKDPLTIADESRPKGKKLIRSEAHPISTSLDENKPQSKTIQDSIRAAFNSKKIRESSEDYISLFDKLKELEGEFWSRMPELIEDIKKLGYDVVDYNTEYIVVASEDDDGEDYELQIPIGGTARTMTLDFKRAHKL